MLPKRFGTIQDTDFLTPINSTGETWLLYNHPFILDPFWSKVEVRGGDFVLSF